MPRHTRRLQKQVASLFLLAEDAFGCGKTQLGEELTSLALRYLDELHAPETACFHRERQSPNARVSDRSSSLN